MKKSNIDYKVAQFLLFFIFPVLLTNAQKIEGKIKTEKSSPVEFAQVAVLLKKDSSFVNAVMSDSLGYFKVENIPSNDLIFVKITNIGFIDTSFTVNSEQNDILLITLKQSIQELKGVTITAKKPLIERKIDRIVFNVDNSVFSSGFFALDILRKIPRIEVTDNDEIRLIGKSSLQVMIDGRIIPLVDNNLKNRLKSLRSDDIAKIEIITSPPARYSANGNSGLINIITKNSLLLGWRNNISSTFIQRTNFSVLPSYSLAYKGRKTEFSMELSGFDDNKVYKNNNTIKFANSRIRESETIRDGNAKDLTLNVNLGYDINSKSRIGLIGGVENGTTRDDGKTQSLFKSNNKIDSSLTTKNLFTNKYSSGTITAYFDYKIDSTGKKLSLNTNYYLKTVPKRSTISEIDNESNFQEIKNDNDNLYNGYSTNLDLELPYSFGTVESGLSFSKVRNTIDYNITSNMPIPVSVNSFEYKENTYAAYLSVNKKISDKLSFKAGMRYEGTEINGFSETLNKNSKNRYDYFFPSIFLNCDCDKSNSFNVAYTKRMERPYYYLLNPAPVFQTLFIYSVGNTNLFPSISHNLEISHTFKNNFTTFVYISKVVNGIDQLSTLSVDGKQKIEPQNHLSKVNSGISIGYTVSKIRWLNSYNSFDYLYSNSKSSKYQDIVPNLKGYGATISSRNSITLDKNKRYLLDVRYTYNFSSLYDFYTVKPNSILDLGLSAKLLKYSQLQTSLLFRDVFKKLVNQTIRNYAAFSEFNRNYNDIRSIAVSISYTFGNKDVYTNDKYIRNSNKSRTFD